MRRDTAVIAPTAAPSAVSPARPAAPAVSGPVGPPSRPSGAASRIRHQPALDGLRGLAVLGVVLYHAGVSWVPGGFLGVDAFFVLSGFLITTLLLEERRRSGTIDLRRFWVRRARRLLPALGVLLLAVSAMVAATGTATERQAYPRDAGAALLYVANWRFAYSDQGYFAHTSPSPLLHLWSLGVEEQFYVVWPLVVATLLGAGWLGRRLAARRGGTTGPPGVGRIALAGALASTLLMLVLSLLGTGDDRLYYGTDTRLAPLLVGAALAVVLAHRRQRPGHTSAAALRPGPAAGVLALVLIGLVWATTPGSATWLYRGGFTLMAIAVAVVVATVWNRPGTVLARVLAAPPLAGLGRISYGVYLYHWPVFLLLDHSRTQLSGGGLLALRLAATLTVAVASYTLLERPVIAGTLHLPRPRVVVPATAMMTVGAVLLAAMLPGPRAGSSASLETDAAKLQREMAQRLAELPDPAPARPAPTAPAHQTPAAGPTAPGPAPAATPTARPRPAPAVREPERVFIVGDSIAFSAAWALAAERTTYRVDLLSDAVIGCGIVPLPYGDANSTSPVPLSQCPDWQTGWSTAVAKFQPAVTSVFLGRWETVDRVLDGRVVRVGDPAYDAYLAGLLDRVVTTLSARGGKVAFVALPCYRLPELADGSTSPSDQPARQARFNELLREAVARHPKVASVVDLNAQICPGGVPVSSWNGMPLRQDDGMHFAADSGPVLGRLLLNPLRTVVGLRPVSAP